VSLIFIDSGDGETTAQVYNFCSRWNNTFPSKGFRSIQQRKKEKPDELTEGSFKRYRSVKMSEDIVLYEISTNYYKTHVYNNVKISRQPQDPQKPGFCDFPRDYGQKYFDMLTAEERLIDGSYESHGRRNEALDCRVGALCAADVYLDSEVLNYRAWAKQQKFPFKAWDIQFRSQADIIKITHRTVIDSMMRQTMIKK
jgi:phage terminase large subunit GpA-like protein